MLPSSPPVPLSIVSFSAFSSSAAFALLLSTSLSSSLSSFSVPHSPPVSLATFALFSCRSVTTWNVYPWSTKYCCLFVL